MFVDWMENPILKTLIWLIYGNPLMKCEWEWIVLYIYTYRCVIEHWDRACHVLYYQRSYFPCWLCLPFYLYINFPSCWPCPCTKDHSCSFLFSFCCASHLTCRIIYKLCICAVYFLIHIYMYCVYNSCDYDDKIL